MAESNPKRTQTAADKRKPSSGSAQDTSADPVIQPAGASAANTAFKLNDQEVEKYLISGEHSGMLEDYFGEETYRELSKLAQEASVRSVRGGPRVLIIPGIMGSKIGKKGKIFDDTIWIDPLGRLWLFWGQSAGQQDGRFVDAAGPMLAAVARLLDVELPVFSELHLKTSFEDYLGLVPRDLPFLICDDPLRLDWPAEERDALEADDATRWLTRTLPAGAHMRPEGRNHVLILWPYHTDPVPEVFPFAIPAEYTEICLRGMARLLPALSAYIERLPKPYVDGGYYTRTAENRPLACPLPVGGAFVHGALSGFGIMASSATAELVAAHITGTSLPDYAAAFDLARYDDPGHVARFAAWGDDSQL